MGEELAVASEAEVAAAATVAEASWVVAAGPVAAMVMEVLAAATAEDITVVAGTAEDFTGAAATAALAAAQAGMHVCLTEETSWLGGQMTSQGV